MESHWTLTYQVFGDTLVAQVIDPETGDFRVTAYTPRNSTYNTPGYCPHAFLNHITTRNGKAISSETMHIVTDFDFDGMTRTEIESFISALVNYVTTTMFTSIQSRKDLDDLVKGYSLK